MYVDCYLNNFVGDDFDCGGRYEWFPCNGSYGTLSSGGPCSAVITRETCALFLVPHQAKQTAAVSCCSLARSAKGFPVSAGTFGGLLLSVIYLPLFLLVNCTAKETWPVLARLLALAS